jgi:hypothetical protein
MKNDTAVGQKSIYEISGGKIIEPLAPANILFLCGDIKNRHKYVV